MDTNKCDILLIGCETEENLGLRSIAASLTRNGVQAKIEPYHKSLKEKIFADIVVENPKIVGFSLIFQRMLFEFADLISYLRQNGISAHFTMGGHFPTIEYERTLEVIPGLDSVVRHEGERTLLELFQNLDQPNSWDSIKGIAYRKDGKIKVTPPRPLIQNLDSLPFPLRSNKVMTHRGLGMCAIIASRGCYYNCSFCSIHTFYREPSGPKRRSRSPSHVAQEMEELFLTRGIRIFVFKDDDLCTRGRKQRQWIEDFARELEKRRLADQILWRISCRVDEVDSELLMPLKEVGLTWLYIGIESGSNQGLKTFNKHYTVDDIYKAIRNLQKLEIPFEFGFMIFDPDSTMGSIKENIDFLKRICKNGQATAHFTKMFPYAGTTIAQRLKKEGRLKGTIALPDYTFKDPRLNLLQFFFSQAFHSRNFGSNSLVNQLQLAKFDTMVLKKFFLDEYDVHRYAEAVQELTRQSNDSALKAMRGAVQFMENRTLKEILYRWNVLRDIAQREMEAEQRIAAALKRLMDRYDFGPIRLEPIDTIHNDPTCNLAR